MAALATLLALLAARGTARLDCACRRLHGQAGGGRAVLEGERRLWADYCQSEAYHYVMERCVTLEQPSVAVEAVGRLVSRDWGSPAPLAADDLSVAPAAGEDCSDALAAIRSLADDEAAGLWCQTATHCFSSCLAEGLNYTEWGAEALATRRLRVPALSHLVAVVRRITDTINRGLYCFEDHELMNPLPETNVTGQTGIRSKLQEFYNYYQLTSQLFPAVVAHLSQLFIPLAFELVGNQLDKQQLDGWINDTEHLRDMLDIKFKGLLHDVQSVTNHIPEYKIEGEGEKSPGNYRIRRPLLSDVLLFNREALISFRDDFSELCQQQHPNTSEMFGLADALYSFYHRNFLFSMQVIMNSVNVTDEKWELEDQSKTVLSVDTGCLQLLANAVDHRTCPLEDLPPDTVRRRRDCREQLWDDMVRRLPHIPVTSYLAYTQRASVNLCLLAWMAANSFSVCEDVIFSMTRSVLDARCYFESNDTESCLQSNSTDVICSVSRAILLLKCRDFSSFKPPETCFVNISTTGRHSDTEGVKWKEGVYKTPGKATGTTLNYKDTLNNATLKYTNFKVKNLKLLETSFVAVNIIFRVLAAGVYMYLPHLRNLPGKIFLSYQLSGIAQILCSEVLYRMAGVLELSTAVLIDSSLTLLSCLWLNTFCYHMYACIRRLRLPNDLSPFEASMVFRRQVLYALIPWSIVCSTCVALEKSSKYYLIHSRIVFLVGISSSIAFNFVFLGLVLYMYRINTKAMKRLKIYSKEDFFSKKQLIFLSVNTIILSGIGVIIRIGFQQAEGIAQYVYYVHIATMMQGPVLFIFFICNETTLPVLRNRVLSWWTPGITVQEQELCSTAERNLARRGTRDCLIAESSL